MLNNIYTVFYMQNIIFLFQFSTCKSLFSELICNISLHIIRVYPSVFQFRLNWLSQFQGIDMSVSCLWLSRTITLMTLIFKIVIAILIN